MAMLGTRVTGTNACVMLLNRLRWRGGKGLEACWGQSMRERLKKLNRLRRKCMLMSVPKIEPQHAGAGSEAGARGQGSARREKRPAQPIVLDRRSRQAKAQGALRVVSRSRARDGTAATDERG